MIVLSNAIKKTERHSEATITPSLAPVGYSGSSENFSKAAASSIGVFSMIAFSPSPSTGLLVVDGVRETCSSLSSCVVDVAPLDASTGGAVVFSSMMGGDEALERERVGNLMVDYK